MLPETRFHVAHLDFLEDFHGLRDEESELAEQRDTRIIRLRDPRHKPRLITDR